eukprot:CAMPEP_0174345022 /NCGR_PEP_ID=MMETSP0811_2-20130205/431_1 /TAXON_ID=73025 ORGANISM="Eutreptiella gymnastica-like, Strain CCMP1594" /NCGR_SAMPLE_ID=MMETSP0811_2 /ASSEMBLY_ACC=CAM_ASM_000667 /LENGTH=66 /DNA_ID=CAMNT_0015468445 /DNA_START=183 /DNA_END=380 /DNA_ORIENTATION=-
MYNCGGHLLGLGSAPSLSMLHGYHSLGYICLLARTEIGTDLGALVLPPMAADFVGQVQACLREAAM